MVSVSKTKFTWGNSFNEKSFLGNHSEGVAGIHIHNIISCTEKLSPYFHQTVERNQHTKQMNGGNNHELKQKKLVPLIFFLFGLYPSGVPVDHAGLMLRILSGIPQATWKPLFSPHIYQYTQGKINISLTRLASFFLLVLLKQSLKSWFKCQSCS